jgi:hypothetical protein
MRLVHRPRVVRAKLNSIRWQGDDLLPFAIRCTLDMYLGICAPIYFAWQLDAEQGSLCWA